ncbi:MAG: aminotransferase class III-fold pyridoxal phosphate-dependent enzyme [Saprospiraceae bacterium]
MEASVILSVILELYGLSGVLKALPGEVDLNYRFKDSDGRKFVFKVAGPERTREEIAFQVAFLEHLSHQQTQLPFSIPAAHKTLAGETYVEYVVDSSPRLIHMLTWVEGRPLRVLTHKSKTLLRQWGGICGQLSKALQGFDHPQAHQYYRWDPQHSLDAKVNLKHVNRFPEPVEGPAVEPTVRKSTNYEQTENTPTSSLLSEPVEGPAMGPTVRKSTNYIDSEKDSAKSRDSDDEVTGFQEDMGAVRKSTNYEQAEITPTSSLLSEPHSSPLFPEHGTTPRFPEPVEGPSDNTALAQYFFNLFETEAKPKLAHLRHSVNYNDAHEDNLLVNDDPLSPRIVGLVDVGDAVYTQTVNELAIACAYAGMDTVDPIAAMAEVVSGYHAVFPLEENELEVLFPLIAGRLLITVTSAAEARANEPENAYRSVSEDQAWAVLRKLKSVHPRLAKYHFRAACGLEPCPRAQHFQTWLNTNPAFSPIVKVEGKRLAPLDLSVGSRALGNYSNYTDLDTFSKRIETMLQSAKADIGYGGYLETRPVYTTELFEEQGNDGPRWRTVHLGLDLWSSAGTEVMCPYPGRVHSFRQNNNPRDYGATIVLEHDYEVEGEMLQFFTLFGHLSAASLQGLSTGQEVLTGEVIATFGEPDENGGWPPHVHFQVMLDLLDKQGDFAGVAFPEEAKVYASICPNAANISGISGLHPTLEIRTAESIDQARKKHLGRSLSLSYDAHLHMVRGQGPYLLDATGRRYLDTVNNVAHVGHEHPVVVNAIQEQAAVLNTNTRYLHEEIVAFAEELCATLPPELSVVHVVNSGSEANELALRMARASTGQKDMIAIEVGYHGNTNAVIDISSYKFDGKGGEGAPSTTHIVPIPDVYRGFHNDPATAGEDYADYLDTAIESVQSQGRGIAGFISESILSCGGQVVLPEGYLLSAFAKTRAAGGICISDEVQVGVGRVGEHFWGFQLQDVVPDVVVIGKPIGNGHPLGVVVCTEAMADAFAVSGMEYFNTFGGNPVSCAAGRAVLRVVREEGLQANAKEVGDYLLAGLRDLQTRHPIIGDVRGHGFFLGVELVRDHVTLEPADTETSYIANRMRERGVLMSTDGPHHNVLKIKPPMCFGMQEAEVLIGSLDGVLGELIP